MATSGEDAGRVVTADEVRAMVFRTTRYREGYDRDHVDGVMHRAEAALSAREAGRPFGHLITAEEVRDTRLAVTKYREGYEQDHVDDFLDRVILALQPDSGQEPSGLAGAVPAPMSVAPSTRASRGTWVVPGVLLGLVLGLTLLYFIVA